MLEFQEKRKIKKLFYSKITLVCLVVLIVLLLNMVWDLYKKQETTKDNLTKTAATFEELQAREKMLSSEIDRLKTEGGIEEEIRDKYGLVKPGEEVIMMVNQDDSTSSDATSSGDGLWQKIGNWFK